MNVLVAVDGSPEADRAAHCVVPSLTGRPLPCHLGVAESHGLRRPQHRVRGVYPYPMNQEPLIDEAEERATEIVHESVESLGLSDAEEIAEVGDPAAAIIAAADEHHADVIVVAASQKGWFSRLVTGSVSDALVHRAHVPVLVAR
ncbi:MAG: universal stress protein [Ilumatobacteraceae bacterium]